MIHDLAAILGEHVKDTGVIPGDSPKNIYSIVAKTAFVSPLDQRSQLSSHEMRHVMVVFRFRKSWWQMNGEDVYIRLEHASSPARRSIRAHVHRTPTILL
jgi:hypothetical protein